MNSSSRWCVTAVAALGALACSDPVPPPAQGAFVARINSVSPPVAGKACPSGAAFTYDVPAVDQTLIPPQALTESTYKHRIIDGEKSAKVDCKVHGSSTFTFEGRIALNGNSVEISNGTFGADKKGTARITVSNSARLGSGNALSAPSANCAIEPTLTAKGELQIQAGSMWATFSCPSVEHQPSDSCSAEGIFVLENCEK